MKEYFEDLGNYLSLKDRVYQNIKFQIMRGTLKPGTRLPEEELSKIMSSFSYYFANDRRYL